MTQDEFEGEFRGRIDEIWVSVSSGEKGRRESRETLRFLPSKAGWLGHH
jgi:hypothetical protein